MGNHQSEFQQHMKIEDQKSQIEDQEKCIACEGKGRVEYLCTGHFYECDWCQGTGRCSRETNDRYWKMMSDIHREFRIWTPI